MEGLRQIPPSSFQVMMKKGDLKKGDRFIFCIINIINSLDPTAAIWAHHLKFIAASPILNKDAVLID